MKNTKVFIREFQEHVHTDLLKDIYLDESLIEYQEKRYIAAITKYEDLFGEGEVEIYSAPGRSEVGGNHTDHQFGCVLATSINLDALAIVGPNEGSIRLVSEGYDDMIEVSLDDLERNPAEEGTTVALIRGMAAKLKETGYQIGGFQAYVTSDVLVGAGLSSSAAFETIIGTILSGLYNDMKVSPVLIAQAGQYAENIYFGKPCGLMDQMACSVGGLINIDFADPSEPVMRKVEVEFEDYHHSLCIVDTKGSHADLTDEYAAVPAEMKAVAEKLGKPVLRQIDAAEFYKKIPELREEFGDRPVLRAIHFLNENERVGKQVAALNEGRFQDFLQLVKESGNSSYKYLQNVYTNKDVQNQAMSIGLAVAETVLGTHGVSRVHGGGFAGTIQIFVENEFVPEIKAAMDGVFGEGSCHVLKVRKYGGMKVLA
ncbi:MAG: galactokinase family protein [Lachnospiraceae bacterium]|nr:galactokinase family protein [Lachnospiraceae bacterium]